jgi:hypothetical protein
MMPHTCCVGSQQPWNWGTSSHAGSGVAGKTHSVVNPRAVPRNPQRSLPSNVAQHGTEQRFCSNSVVAGHVSPPHVTLTDAGSHASGDARPPALPPLPAFPAVPLAPPLPPFPLALGPASCPPRTASTSCTSSFPHALTASSASEHHVLRLNTRNLVANTEHASVRAGCVRRLDCGES